MTSSFLPFYICRAFVCWKTVLTSINNTFQAIFSLSKLLSKFNIVYFARLSTSDAELKRSRSDWMPQLICYDKPKKKLHNALHSDDVPIRNIVRGTTDPVYWVYNLSLNPLVFNHILFETNIWICKGNFGNFMEL